ncbi:pitrilysin family protein [Kitasatospora sp. GP82]|uniref:M16 family metallopeptidase n=1 Tax=Kitasatospora sp. GP82 TaxID=3035089 RepID=UPI00247662CC|nr:pitrilysin family protein [Kitasatospora sp. GP82]MDH6123601.1 zinc protease [Kitasatospora sp. GP82]
MRAELIPGPPAAGIGRPYIFPEVIRRGGLLAADLPGCPTAYAALLFDHGIFHEPTGKEGLLQLLFAVLREGGERLGRDELAFELEGLGATWFTTVGDDFVQVATVAPTASITEAVRIISETVRRPRLAAEAVARVRDNQVSALATNWSNPGRRQTEALARALYRTGRQTVLPGGTTASLSSISARVLGEYHQQHIAEAGRLVLAGDIDGIDLDEVATLSPVERIPPAASTPRAVPREAMGRDIVVVNRPGAVGARITLAHHVPLNSGSLHSGLTVATHILGGTTHSRLTRELRDRRGHVYAVNAGLQLSSCTGVFSVSTQTAIETAGEVVKTVFHEIESMRLEGVTPEELKSTLVLLTGQFPITYLTPQAVGMALGGMASIGARDDFYTQKYRELASLDRAAVNEAARNHLSSSDLTVVVEGPAPQLTEILSSAELGPVRIDNEGVA